MNKGIEAMFTNAKDATDYIFAGNATFTIVSTKTNKHLTFKVKAPKDGNVHFVNLLTGSNNETDYTYIGMVKDGKFALTKKSKMTSDSVPVKAFNYMVEGLNADQIRDNLQIMHNGTCGRCNRLLTVPESLTSGFGPECRKKGLGPQFTK